MPKPYGEHLKTLTNEQLLDLMRTAWEFEIRYGAKQGSAELVWFECCERGLKNEAQKLYQEEKLAARERARANMERIQNLTNK